MTITRLNGINDPAISKDIYVQRTFVIALYNWRQLCKVAHADEVPVCQAR